MKDFNKIIKDAVEGYEAPFDSSAWDKFSQKLDPVEEVFREAVEGYELPYNPSAWTNLSGKLGWNTSYLKIITGSAALLAVVFGVYTFMNDVQVAENPIGQQITDVNQAKDQSLISNDDVNSNSSQAFTGDDLEDYNFDDANSPAQTDVDGLKNNPSLKNNKVGSIFTDDSNASVKDKDAVKIDPLDKKPNDIKVSPIANPIDKDPSTTLPLTCSADFSMSENEICQFSVILFNPREIRGNLVYHWNFGDGNESDLISPRHKFEKTGEFNVQLSIYNPKNNELIARTENSVKINETPKANFEWSKGLDAIPTITFVKNDRMNDVLIWKVDGRVLADKPEFEHTFRQAGTHSVSLRVKNEFGCSNESIQTIQIEGEDYNLFAPTAFTPNENINNRFIPQALTLLDNPFTMNIYNQSGELIYDTKNADMGWDGVNGNDNGSAPAGTYVWIVILENNNGVKETYKGTFILFR